LKKHYITHHHLEELREKKVRIEPLIDALAKRQPIPQPATDTHNVFEEQKTLSKVKVDERTWAQILELEPFVPILKLLAMEGAEQGIPLEPEQVPVSLLDYGG
jgi:hypothetical protein